MRKKCINCRQMFDESQVRYEKSRNLLSKKPLCFCKECRRVYRCVNPTEEMIEAKRKKEEKRAFINKKNQDIRTSIKIIEQNPIVIKQVNKNTEIRRIKGRLEGAKTRVIRKKANIPISEEEKKAIRKLYEECPLGCHVDHIIPISKGGKHCLSNLQYLSANENLKKSNNITLEILEKFAENGTVSKSFLQWRFKVSYKEAEKIMTELGLCSIT